MILKCGTSKPKPACTNRINKTFNQRASSVLKIKTRYFLMRYFCHVGVWLTEKELAQSMLASRVLLEPFEAIIRKRKEHQERARNRLGSSNSILISLDSRFLYSFSKLVSNHWQFTLWDILDLTLYKTMNLTIHNYSHLIASQHGFLYNMDDCIHMFHLEKDTKTVYQIPQQKQIHWMQYSPSCHWVIAFCEDKYLYWFYLHPDPQKIRVWSQRLPGIQYHRMAKDSKKIAIVDTENEIHVIDFNYEKVHLTIRHPYNRIDSVCFANENRYLFFATTQERIIIYDLDSDNITRHILHYDLIYNDTFISSCFLYSFANMVYGLGTRSLFKFSLETQTYTHQDHNGIIKIFISPNERYLLYAHQTKIIVYDIAQNKEHCEFPFRYLPHRTKQVHFSPNSEIVFIINSSAYYSFQVWHLETKTCLYSIN